MAAVPYETEAGEMLDLIAYRHYGYSPGAVEAILEANPGLCEYPPVLPAGVRFTLPDIAPAAPKSAVRLWD